MLRQLATVLALIAAPAIAQITILRPFGPSHVRVLNPFGAPQGSVRRLATTSGIETYSAPPVGANGLALKTFDWGGHRWSNDSGQTWNLNVPYAIGLGTTKARFEVHDTSFDRGSADASTQRRAEMSMGNKLDRFFNDRDYWHAFTFVAHVDCVTCLTQGGTIMQMHWPSNGNPAFAFRLVNYNGGYGLRITTRSDSSGNVIRYTGPLTGDVPHDLVYYFKLDGAAGELEA
jgi:hypothetical protein